MNRIQEIRRKISFACEEGLKPFGYQSHRWRMNQPITSKELNDIEKSYSILLPEEYRSFILTVGNGGAGPGYGMFPLETGIEYHRELPEKSCLSQEFPHADYYNPYDDITLDTYRSQLSAGKISEAEYDAILSRSNFGTLVVCHEGSGHLHRMIVSGPARGSIWIDSTCSDQGFIPLEVSFLEWYERWIDDVLLGKGGTWWFNQ